MEQDGPTKITVGRGEEVACKTSPAFDGILKTPSRIVLIATSERKTVFETPVQGAQTRIRLWTNHPSEPDEAMIGID
jgi:hypothetical protein